MTFEEIRKDIKARKYKPIYFLCGEEPFFIDRLTALLENTVLTEDEKAFKEYTGMSLEKYAETYKLDRDLILTKELDKIYDRLTGASDSSSDNEETAGEE